MTPPTLPWWTTPDLVSEICFLFGRRFGLISKCSWESERGRIYFSKDLAEAQPGLAGIKVLTNSTVEHDGDEGSLLHGIREIAGSANITAQDGKEYRVTVREVAIGQTARSDQHGDDEYTFAVNVRFVVQIDRIDDAPAYSAAPFSATFQQAWNQALTTKKVEALPAKPANKTPTDRPTSMFAGALAGNHSYGHYAHSRGFVPYSARMGRSFY